MPPPRGTPNPIEGPGDYDVTTEIHNDSYPAISPLSIAPINKSVFITGASRGLGLAIAISFAQAGASQIAIGARRTLDSAKEAILSAAASANRPAPKVLSVSLEISSQSSVDEVATLVEKEFGKLDIVILNAGVIGTPALIGDSKPDEWWNVLNVNLKGQYLITRAFLPLLLKGGDKTIITVASVGGHCVTPAMSAYQTSKLANIRFMEFVSKEYGEKGVLAFSIHPGNVDTDMARELVGSDELPDYLKLIMVETPRLSGDTLVYLVKEKRDWLAGRYINVTWNMPELMAQKDRIVKGDKLKVKLDF